MNIEEAKNLISNNMINKDNAMDAILSFENHTTEEYFRSFCNLVFQSSYYWAYGSANRLLSLLEQFEHNIEDNPKNKYNLLYTRATIYLYIKDGIRAVQTCFKIRDIDNLPKDGLFYSDNIIVNALYDNKEYEYALEENLRIYNSDSFSNLDIGNQIIVIANNALIYISLDNYEKALWYYNQGLNYLKEFQNADMHEVFELLDIFMIFKFGTKYYSDNEINFACDRLLAKFENNINNKLYENISIYEEIFDKLINSGRKDIVYNICHKFLKILFNVYDISSIYRYLLLSISKKNNYDEYVSCLEKYAKLLEEKNNQDKYTIKSFYDQTSKFYYQNKRYTHDPLTNCLSRGIYEERKVNKDAKSLIYLDLNNLKKVNDVNGHSFGDQYIKNFANNLLSCFDTEYVFRIGGDEFVVISKHLEADELVNRLIKLNDMPLFFAKKNDKFSAGVVINCDELTIEELTNIADECLYKAKNSKTDFYIVYNK